METLALQLLYFYTLLIPFLPFVVGVLLYVFGPRGNPIADWLFPGDAETRFRRFRNLTIAWIISTAGFAIGLSVYLSLS